MKEKEFEFFTSIDYKFDSNDRQIINLYLNNKIRERDLPTAHCKFKDVMFFTNTTKSYRRRAIHDVPVGFWRSSKAMPTAHDYDGTTIGSKQEMTFLQTAQGTKETDWVMCEFASQISQLGFDQDKEDEVVVCKVYQKNPPGKDVYLQLTLATSNASADAGSSCT